MPGAVIPNDWDGESWKCWSVEWPDSVMWFALLEGFISTPRMGRYWNGETGTITEAQVVGVEILDRNQILEEVLMTCNEDSLAVLGEIRDAILAIANRDCCPTGGAGSGVFNSGSRGSGITEQPPNPYTENPVTEDPPNGFDSWAQYRAHKCNAAHDLVKHFKVDLLSLSNLEPSEEAFTAIVAELVAVLLTPIPYDDIASLVGLLTVAALEYSLLAELSAQVQDNAEDLICTLYNSSNSDGAETDFRTAVTILIGDVTGISLAQTWLENICNHLLTFDAYNRLFEPGPTEEQEGDCAACAPDTNIYRVCFEEFADIGDIIDSTETGGCGTGSACQSIYLRFNTDPFGSPEGTEVMVDLEVISGDLENCGEITPGYFDYYDTAGSQIGSRLSAPDDEICCRSILIISGGGSFSVRVNGLTPC